MGQGEEGSGANPAWLLPLSPTTTIHATGPIYLVDASSLGGPLAQQLFARQRRGGGAFRPGRRLALQGLLLAALLTVALLSFFEPHLRDGLAQALLRAGAGRGPPPARDLDFPVQSCCIGQQCVRNSKGRHAVVTHVHSQREVTQLLVRRGQSGAGRCVVAFPLLRGRLLCWHKAARRHWHVRPCSQACLPLRTPPTQQPMRIMHAAAPPEMP